ncbi:MAG: hypothetical protein EHM93_05780 [Bacteroidales bacterium]|nr:MAG: hypothetical protein EHM93_05780 [Bacteroidales bacterium]
MADENPYLSSLDNNSDDEIFEIISNPDEMENSLKYTAALTVALKREMISEYQAENLLDGNTTVLDYNPNIIDKQVEDFREEKAIHRKESRRKLTNIQYGLMLIGGGVVLLLFLLYDDLLFPTRTKFIGISSIVMGFLLVIIGYIDRWRKKRKREENPQYF